MLPYNQPTADADFDHWCKAQHWCWTKLLLWLWGRLRRLCHGPRFPPSSRISPFALKYSRLRDLALRAKQWEKLFDPVLPIIFVRWAQSNEIDLPAELVSSVEARKGNWTDWKTLYEDAVANDRAAILKNGRRHWSRTANAGKKSLQTQDEFLAAKDEEIVRVEANDRDFARGVVESRCLAEKKSVVPRAEQYAQGHLWDGARRPL